MHRNVYHMPKMIQLRHVPDTLHRRLKARAAGAGLSLSDYLIREMRKVAETPTLDEVMQRIAQRSPVTTLTESPAEIIRAERDDR